MLDYVDSKERQGVFFEKPSEKIHLPEAGELALMDHSKWILVNVILNIRGKHFLGGFVQVVMENFRMPLWRGIVKWQRSVTEWQVIECFQHWFASPHCFLLSVQAQNLFVRGSKDNTKFEAKLTSSMLRKGFNTNKLMIIELID